MIILRTFMRLEGTSPEAWSLRMDGLMAADPKELLEFVGDALIAIAAAAPPGSLIGRDGMPPVLSMVETAVRDSEPIVELARRRYADVLAALGEHTSTDEARRRLWRISREAPWEPET